MYVDLQNIHYFHKNETFSSQPIVNRSGKVWIDNTHSPSAFLHPSPPSPSPIHPSLWDISQVHFRSICTACVNCLVVHYSFLNGKGWIGCFYSLPHVNGPNVPPWNVMTHWRRAFDEHLRMAGNGNSVILGFLPFFFFSFRSSFLCVFFYFLLTAILFSSSIPAPNDGGLHTPKTCHPRHGAGQRFTNGPANVWCDNRTFGYRVRITSTEKWSRNPWIRWANAVYDVAK